tara:strand:+ start:115 stop:327 length:213 start_codon:yes stop_codon:yes gene_type:complete
MLWYKRELDGPHNPKVGGLNPSTVTNEKIRIFIRGILNLGLFLSKWEKFYGFVIDTRVTIPKNYPNGSFL